MIRSTNTITRVVAVALAAAVLTLSAPSARAGENECLSSKLANELMDCAHCNAVKKLLSHRSIGEVSMEVHEIDHGAIVEIEATHPTAVQLVHDLVDEIWKPGLHCETTLSEVCTARYHALEKCEIDRALTSHGALVVLRGASDADVAWILADARDTRSYVLAAASR